MQAGPAELPAASSHYDFVQIPVHHRAVCQVQPLLTVDVPGDRHEQEAERVSRQVVGSVAAPAPRFTAAPEGGPAGARPDGNRVMPPNVLDVVRADGQPLDSATRAFMEPRVGHDFSRVRVHADRRAADSAQAMHALAYTVGLHIVFGAGQFAPTSASGRRVLAHELSHVVQQEAAGPRVQRYESTDRELLRRRIAGDLANASDESATVSAALRNLEDRARDSELTAAETARQSVLTGRQAALDKRIGRADADLRLLDEPGARATALAELRARRGRTTDTAAVTETESTGARLSEKGLVSRDQAQTSQVVQGTAKTITDTRSSTLTPTSFTQERGLSSKVVAGDTSTATSVDTSRGVNATAGDLAVSSSRTTKRVETDEATGITASSTQRRQISAGTEPDLYMEVTITGPPIDASRSDRGFNKKIGREAIYNRARMAGKNPKDYHIAHPEGKAHSILMPGEKVPGVPGPKTTPDKKGNLNTSGPERVEAERRRVGAEAKGKKAWESENPEEFARPGEQEQIRLRAAKRAAESQAKSSAAKTSAAKASAPKADAPKTAVPEPVAPKAVAPEPVAPVAAPKPSTPRAGRGGPKRGGGGGGTVGGLLSLVPGIALGIAQDSAQARMDEAARQRGAYRGMPTPEQIELQDSCGYHFTGQLDSEGRPIWQYKPSGWQNFRWNFMELMDPFGGPQPGGSQNNQSPA